MFAFTSMSVWAQSSFPPKSFPASIKVTTDAGVAQYWDVNRILCLGKSGNGYKFRIIGKGNADMGSQSITMYYMLPGNKLEIAGAYRFPAIEKGKNFNFEIVSAFNGYAPKAFQGFMIMDENFKAPETIEEPTPLPDEISATIRPTYIPLIVEEEAIEPEIDYDAVYEKPETLPSFPGGNTAIFANIAKNLRYPLMAQENNVQGRVIVGFVIDKDGSVTDVKVIKGVERSLDNEAVRVIKALPKFSPGKMRGIPVKTAMTFPVTFKLN